MITGGYWKDYIGENNMRIKQFFGVSILVSIFGAFFVFIGVTSGFITALVVFGVTGGFIALASLAVWLLTS